MKRNPKILFKYVYAIWWTPLLICLTPPDCKAVCVQFNQSLASIKSLNEMESSKVDTSEYKNARIFPGLVSAEEARPKVQTISSNSSYKLVPKEEIGFNLTPQYWICTALWRGLNENATYSCEQAPMQSSQVAHDVSSVACAQRTGFPEVTANNLVFEQAARIDDAISSGWNTYHEIRYDMQMNSNWSFKGKGEVPWEVWLFYPFEVN